ncbi:MAG TPA: hypothetical protein DDY68_04645 [Porphyromonadaceae bacterium]|nr:hypothetical protein [Porphyromonadaceae bacterium]
MEQQRVDMFMMSNGKFFPEEKMTFIRETLLALYDEDKWTLLTMTQFKDPVIALVLSLFAGPLAIDRFYLEDNGLGLLKLLTCGGFGIWAIVDWFLIMDATKEKNFEKLMTYFS